jgi:hypothetical protein
MVDLRSTGLNLNFRPGFALAHMRTAVKLSVLCGDVEAKNKGARFGPFFDDIIDYSTACVTCSVAALECYINEIYIDRLVNFDGHSIKLMDDLWDVLERKSAFEKYQFALLLRNKEKLDPASQTIGNAKVLVKLRNALVHFKPEWIHLQEEHDRLGRSLDGRFAMSPFLLTAEPVFPMRCMSHAMTKWAISTIYQVIKEFSEASGIENRLERFEQCN